MTEDQMTTLKNKVFSLTGMQISNVQLPALDSHVSERLKQLSVPFEYYLDLLTSDLNEYDLLVNQIAVNETYFFREEKQFDFLKNEVFPAYYGKSMNIWSAASSTGEEAISLYSLATECGIDAHVYATDIDPEAIATFKAGLYSSFSLRPDGKKYHEILKKNGSTCNNQFMCSPQLVNQIQIARLNLVYDEYPAFPKFDLIFMRNVFIYFDTKTRQKVTHKVSAYLKNGGLLFFSMNEIGCIGPNIVPKELMKKNHDSVYYFEKENPEEKDVGSKPLTVEDPKVREEKEKKRQAFIEALKKEQEKRPQTKVAGSGAGFAGGATLGTASIGLGTSGKGVTPSLSSASAVGLQTIGSASGLAGAATLTSQPLPLESKAAKVEAENKLRRQLRSSFEQICGQIDSSDFDKARQLSNDLAGSVEPVHRFYFIFMKGYTEYYADNKTVAESLFSTVEILKSDFWPAYFFHGLVLRDAGRNQNAEYCFKKCQSLLNSFGTSNPYDFLLDSFSPAYINNLCEKFVKSETADGN